MFFFFLALLFGLPLFQRAINHRYGVAPFRILGSLRFEFIACSISHRGFIGYARGNRARACSWNMVNSTTRGTTLQYVKQLFCSHFLRYRYACDSYLLGVTGEMSSITLLITYPISRVRTLRGIFRRTCRRKLSALRCVDIPVLSH